MLKHIHKRATTNRKKYYIVLAGFVSVLLVLYVLLVRPVMALKGDFEELRAEAGVAKTAWEGKDYVGIKNQESRIKKLVEDTEEDFQRLGYLRYFPWVRGYYQDGEHLLNAAEHALAAAEPVIEAVEPFKEVLGFNVQTVKEVTAEEKIAQLVQVSPHLVPSLKTAASEINLVRAELAQVKTQRYPQEFRGIQIRDFLTQTQTSLNSAETLLNQAEPVLTSLPEALGEPTPQIYLVLFQNDKELRPTGGFITAYALVRFDRGNFEIIESDNIYEIDPQGAILPAPQPIINYLKVPSWHMRDTNFSPDFMVSMRDFEAYYRQTSLPKINGIVALDTHFLQELMRITGSMEIEGYDLDFSEQRNLPESCREGGTQFTAENVVCRLELYTQRILLGSDGRKDILGQMMDKMVERMLASDAAEWPKYLEVLQGEAADKHVLFYLHPPALQNLAESYNWAGRIKRDLPAETDYLHINDANLAGLKADMYLIREVLQNVEVADDGTVTKTLTLIYNNPEPQDGWLNATARNYVRVYVPQGSELISFTGDKTREPRVYEDLGKTVFDNFILIPPLDVRSVEIKYKLPFKLKKPTDYQLEIQKQPGKALIPHEIIVNDQKQQLDIHKDTVVNY